MVDSRAKGQRGEYQMRDLLRKHTGLAFERVPASGALAYMKGDLFVPNRANRFCIECKNYLDSHLNDKMFTNKTNYVVKWWTKIEEQAAGQNQLPLLFFKYSRSKIFVATTIEPSNMDKYMYINWLGCYVLLAEEWLLEEKESFIQ